MRAGPASCAGGEGSPQIKAVLSVGQELSQIQDQGINPDWSQRNF